MNAPERRGTVTYGRRVPVEQNNLKRRTYLVISGVHFPYDSFTIKLTSALTLSSDWPYGEPTIDDDFRRPLGDVALSPLKHPRAIVWMEEAISPPVSGPVDQRHMVQLDACDIALMVAARKTQTEARRVIIEEHSWDGGRSTQLVKPLSEWSSTERTPERRLNFDQLPLLCQEVSRWIGAPDRSRDHFVMGLRAFILACQQSWVEDRFALFCRAVEVITQSRPGKGACTFAETLLALDGQFNRDEDHEKIKALEALYRRRNEVVHGHRFFTRENDEAASQQMECLARRYLEALLLDGEFYDATKAVQESRVGPRPLKEHSVHTTKDLGPIPPSPKRWTSSLPACGPPK